MVRTPPALGPLGTAALVAAFALAGEGLGALSPAGDGRHAPQSRTAVGSWTRADHGLADLATNRR